MKTNSTSELSLFFEQHSYEFFVSGQIGLRPYFREDMEKIVLAQGNKKHVLRVVSPDPEDKGKVVAPFIRFEEAVFSLNRVWIEKGVFWFEVIELKEGDRGLDFGHFEADIHVLKYILNEFWKSENE